jgi:DNA-binding transcriptional LysR family regulator
VRLPPRLLVDDVEAQLQAVRAGRGIARPLSHQVTDELAAKVFRDSAVLGVSSRL